MTLLAAVTACLLVYAIRDAHTHQRHLWVGLFVAAFIGLAWVYSQWAQTGADLRQAEWERSGSMPGSKKEPDPRAP